MLYSRDLLTDQPLTLTNVLMPPVLNFEIRESDLFKRFLWRTDAPVLLDSVKLPDEAGVSILWLRSWTCAQNIQKYRQKLLEEEKYGQSDLKDICNAFLAPSDDKPYSVAELFDTYDYTKAQRSSICSSILQYRVLDLLSWKQEGPDNKSNVNLDVERRPLPKMSHLVRWFKLTLNMTLKLKPLNSLTHRFRIGLRRLSRPS